MLYENEFRDYVRGASVHMFNLVFGRRAEVPAMNTPDFNKLCNLESKTVSSILGGKHW
jgi:hypothetical protein